jgi:quinol monooxygenase YgiN
MKYGLFGKFTAHPGKRDELLSILLKAADLLKNNNDCIHYLVGTSESPNDVWVIETWKNKEAHDKSLEPEEIRALIQQAMPLIASMSDQTELSTHGGKGIN